jgi:class 3 adenylate cyclase
VAIETSWNDIILAGKIKKQEAEKALAKKRGVFSPLIKALQYVGILKDDKEELRRQMAATKIQRAWRVVLKGLQSHQDDDEAWKGGGRGGPPVLEKAQKKRSILHHAIPAGIKSGLSSGLTILHQHIPAPKSFANEPPTISHVTDQSERGQSESRKRRNESQVGSAMRELTGQRVAIGIILALIVTVLLTYKENSAARPTTMMILHKQTQLPAFVNRSLDAARGSSVPDLYRYTLANGDVQCFDLVDEDECKGDWKDLDDLRDRERLRITVSDPNGQETTGYFDYSEEIREEALQSILSTIFVLLVWFFGVTSFAGPVMILVVIPIERMVRLLGMLMLDPLGYTSTSRYKRFAAEEDEITKNTHWTKEVLKGMETSFLMSTILRIGSLMKVGFGSAGVEIIRNNLQKGQTKNELRLSDKGVTVSCIFLFSDIRQFTDATECLQEEVFVFTNKIAAVVHSICHAYGGSANKNIGDAFLLSWLLDEHEVIANDSSSYMQGKPGTDFAAKHNQADKALLSVVKICLALQHDEEYLKELGEVARDALITKLAGRTGPIVQMGFGLHAGNAVQGAIGSTRKIDATYVSEAVERAEYLESSTKKYGLKMLMSDAFHRLLHPSNRRRCRKIDQIIIRNEEDDDEDDDGLPDGDIIELLTFDMDIDALWADTKQGTKQSDTGRESDSDMGSEKGSRRMKVGAGVRQVSNGLMKAGRRISVIGSVNVVTVNVGSDELSDGNFMVQSGTGKAQADNTEGGDIGPPAFVLPKGPALYNANVWVSEHMQKMRKRYIDGLFFQNFNAGLHSFYNKDWDHATLCFQNILDRFEDGPSRHFLTQIEASNGKPPRNFQPYTIE